METAALKWLIFANSIIGFSACASAQDIDVGKMEYQSSCAACHGIDAKGNGPGYSPPLSTRFKFADDYIYAPPGSPEPVIRSRILAVIDYLNRMQEK